MHRSPWLVAFIAAIFTISCARELQGDDPPLDRPHYPVGSAVQPGGQRLAVVSSNFDLQYNRGALLVADIARVDAALVEDEVVTVTDAYINGGFLSSFGALPTFSPSGEHLFVPTRGENQIAEALFDENNELICDAQKEGACDDAPNTLQLPGNDPYQVAILSEGERIQGVAALVASPIIVFFEVRKDRDDAARLRLVNPQLNLGDFVGSTDEIVSGTRALVVREAQDRTPQKIFAAVERTIGLSTSVDLVHFDAQSAPSQVNVIPLQEISGSRSARALALNENQDTLYLLLRNPDALMRFSIADENGEFMVRPQEVVSVCQSPTDIKSVRVGEVERVLVSCFDNDALVAYDAQTLNETDRLRFIGRGPFHISTDTEHLPPRAYVSHFDDDSIAVIDLQDSDGLARMVFRARIGEQRITPEDSRQ